MHESFSLHHLSKLPPSLRSRAHAAANGSSADLISLLKLFKFPRVADPKTQLLMPLLYVHLDPARIPKPKELDSTSALSRVTGGIVDLHAVSDLLDALVLQHALYAELWQRLHPWIIFIQTYWDAIPGGCLTMDLHEFHRASALAVLTLREADGMPAVVTKAPGLRRMFAHYWAGTMRDTTIPTDVNMSAILSFLFEPEEIKATKNFTEILDGIGGDARDLAHLIVKQLNMTIAEPLTSPTSGIVGSMLQLLQTCASNQGSPLSAAMLLIGGVGAILRAIAFQEQARLTGSESAGEKVYLGLIFVMGNLEEGGAVAWLSQALSSGLLKLIITLGRARQTESEEILAISQAIPLTSSAAFRKCIIFSFWNDFVDLVDERARVLDLFLDTKLSSSNACENMQCSKTGEQNAFKRCAACKLAFYCSRECQKSDWQAVHRSSCRTLLVKGVSPSNTRGRRYLRAILQYNFQSYSIRATVLNQQAQFMYLNAGVSFLTVFDFTRSAKGTNSTDLASSMASWIKPTADYRATASPRLEHLMRGARDGPVIVYLAALSFNNEGTAVERKFPMRSTPQLYAKLARIVQELPRGLQPAALDAALAKPLRDLATNSAGLMQEIYY
ncbi:hypothetical protein C8R46DRAFT_1246415 [Mycena filopes]|nr:hypothetical protein C8R46DRAFT_1246415 [Mycena filopes]